MKKILLMFFFCLLFVSGFSQDFIFLKDGTMKKAIVVEITPEYVKYNDFENQSGVLYSIYKSDILRILFENGKEKIFSKSNASKNELEMVNNKIYQNGIKLSNKEVKSLFEGTNAYPMYKASKSNKAIGIVSSMLGAICLGAGIACISDDILLSESVSISCLVGGVIITTGGLILTHQASIKMKKSVEIYNQSSSYNNLTMNIGIIGTGIGLRLTF